MTKLVAESIRVVRGRRCILDGISLRAHAGDFIVIIGPNGAGKSTLLSVLAGLIVPDRGMVTLDARPLSSYSTIALAAMRAWLPQNPRLEWPLSVERLVALGLTPRLPATGEIAAPLQPLITRALQLCDLVEEREQVATTLSGGEFARAMLARAIVGEPAILIVDEPISGLDPRHAIASMQLLRRFAQNGALVVASLHDLNLALRYATRLFVLVDGADLEEADPLTARLIHKAFGVTATLTGEGESRSFTFLPTSEK